MSSTRHAPEGAPISYERYMSNPEYAELRAIPGAAVAAKAQIYSEPRQRNLLFFLQSLSVKEGGLRQTARTLSKKFSDISEQELSRYLVELCINPKLSLCAESPSLPSLHKVLNELYDFQFRYEAAIKSDFVITTIGSKVFETLDHALAIGKMVVVEGESGSGKTTAAEAWCAQHQGEARFVSLSGIIHKTGFFHKLATTMGLSASNRKAIHMQIKVEEFFRRTRLMLVIDEAHYLFRHQPRSNSNPELVDWVNTALVNHCVPVALVCTDQFAKQKARVEKQTGWTSEQLEHRVKRYTKLPATPTKEDLHAVTTKLLSMKWNESEKAWTLAGVTPHRDFIKMVVGYALTCKMRLSAATAMVEEARYQARKNGRVFITAADLRSALLDYQIPSDEAAQRTFEPLGERNAYGMAIPPKRRVNSVLQRHCTIIA